MSVPDAKPPGTLEEIAHLWGALDEELWAGRPELYLAFGKKATKLGHPSLGYDILKRGMALFPDHAEMTYHAALGLVRSGATRVASDLANALLDDLDEKSPLYCDALSLAGRIAKDRCCALTDVAKRRAAAEESATRYTLAFEISNDSFPGINAATMALVAGRNADSKRIASEVLELCTANRSDTDPTDHWREATIGEAHLLLGSREQAVDRYARASELAGESFGDIASMRRQVRMLSEHVAGADAALDALAVPAVVAFTGHMIDASDRDEARFPPEIERAVAREITAALERLGAGFGYCSAACGGDILFIEAMLERGAEVHVFLPFRREDFVTTSVAFAGPAWVERLDRCLERATSVAYATREGFLNDDILFAYAADLVHGAAVLRARQLALDPVLLAVAEEEREARVGGTVETTRKWVRSGEAREAIDLGAIRRKADTRAPRSRSTAAAAPASEPETSHHPGFARQVRAMLFADVVGFSKLREEDAPSFFVDFMGHVARLIDASATKPAFRNTWGDGLFIVFDEVAAASDFALRLRDMVRQTDWCAAGLPEGLNIRIGMHAGPVYRAHDAIIGRDNFFGSHVNRAARIEPIAAPGAVFISDQTAYLLASSVEQEFACDYMGATELAKKFGSSALYRLRRVGEAE